MTNQAKTLQIIVINARVGESNELQMVALSKKVFQFASNLTKNLLNHYPEQLLLRLIVLRIRI